MDKWAVKLRNILQLNDFLKKVERASGYLLKN